MKHYSLFLIIITLILLLISSIDEKSFMIQYPRIQIHDDLINALDHIEALANRFVAIQLIPFFDQGLERFKVIW